MPGPLGRLEQRAAIGYWQPPTQGREMWVAFREVWMLLEYALWLKRVFIRRVGLLYGQ